MEKQRPMKNIPAIALTILLTVSSCTRDDLYLHYAMQAAGNNKSELKAVLRHYRSIDKDKEKLRAARYLIANMPAHYSYRDTAAINSYYSKALEILGTGPSPDWQRDTLRQISDTEYAGTGNDIVSDIEVIKASYLIESIDQAFHEWRTRPWARHLGYEEFRDWILPYKVTELQSMDNWRTVLQTHYSDSISTVPATDIERNSIYGAIEIVRNEIHSKQSEIGHRVIWENRSGIPLRSAQTWTRMTYGTCLDYVTMGTAVFRSMGLPATVDQVPSWGRNGDGHSWYVFPDDRGREQVTINSLILGAGMQFYPYERIPKVWRSTYTINRDRARYLNTAKYVYPFDLCQQDVTDRYNLTSDLEIEIPRERLSELKDKKYVYIAMIANKQGPEWKILDYGVLKRGRAHFSNMGRNMLYVALGYNGRELIPVSDPFILGKDGNIRYIHYDGNKTEYADMSLRRKYYESYNVVEQRRKLLGARIQCSDRADFSDAHTLYTIETTAIPSMIELPGNGKYRYWRYLSPDGSWGNISELAWYDENGAKLTGKGIANPEAGQDAIERAYDGNLLSNFEINQPDGNWVGMDMGKPATVGYVSIYPRSDDNDICPDNEYELFFFNGREWKSLGYRLAEDTSLEYDSIPLNTLLWLRNYTRGNDERPFMVREDDTMEWW